MEFKQVKTQIEVPAATIHKNYYICPKCDKRFEFKAEIEKHFSEKHLVIEKLFVAGYRILKFQSKEDVKTFLYAHVYDVSWGNSLYFVVQEQEENYINLVALDVFVSRTKNQIADLQYNILSVLAFFQDMGVNVG